jgi:hypothetical protein
MAKRYQYTFNPQPRRKRPSHRQNLRIARIIESNPILYFLAALLILTILSG